MTTFNGTPVSTPSATIATLVVACLDQYGAPEAGVSVKAKLSKIPTSGTGYAYDATVQEATSGVDGIATLTVVRLATYLVKRGTSKEWTTVVIADEATTEVKSFVGAP